MSFPCSVGALEHFVALYIFATYIEETDFLYDREQMSCYVDFYGSYYMGVVSFVCSVFAGLIVFCDESISRVPKPKIVASQGESSASYEKWYENNGYYYDSEEYNDFTMYNGQRMPYDQLPYRGQTDVVDECYYNAGDPYSMYYDYAYVAARSDVINQPIIEEVPEYQ